MRVPESSISRNYIKTLGVTKARFTAAGNMVASGGRRFLTVSDNPALAVRALNIRRSLARNDGYQDNVKTLQSKYNAGHDAMAELSARCQDILDIYTGAADDNNAEVEYDALAKELTALRDAIINISNTRHGGYYLFGGTNISNDLPLQFNAETGVVTYNGMDVRNITAGDSFTTDVSYVDIGMGMKVDTSGNVDSRSAFANSMRIIDYLGYGDDNLILVLNEMIESCEAGVGEKPLLDKFQACFDKVVIGLETISSDYSYLTYSLGRLESEALNLKERQNAIEFYESDEAILIEKMEEFAYQAALQMGARLLQPSLFSYMK